MKTKKLILYISLTIFSLIILVGSYFLLNKNFNSVDEGKIEIILINLDGEEICKKEIKYSKNETLKEILENNFNHVVIENGMLMSIGELKTESDYKPYISILINDEESSKGILQIEFKDGMKITFKEVIYED